MQIIFNDVGWGIRCPINSDASQATCWLHTMALGWTKSTQGVTKNAKAVPEWPSGRDAFTKSQQVTVVPHIP